MKFQSISIRNFRLFPELDLDFSTDPEKNVTILIGDNGSGKTTLAQAFIWCLFENNKLDDKLWAASTVQKTNKNEPIEVSVTVSLEHHKTVYKFKRQYTYIKKSNNNLDLDKKEFVCIYQAPDEEAKTASESQSRNLLNKILPGKISNFVFFDGEQINMLSEEIRSSKSSSTIESAVRTLLGTAIWENALFHLRSGPNAGRFTCVNKLFNNELESLSNNKETKDYARKRDLALDKINTIKNQINENQKKVDELDKQIKEYKDLLEKNKESAALQKERDGLEKNITERNKIIVSNCVQAKSLLRRELSALAGQQLAFKVLKNLQTVDFNDKDIPDITCDTINYLLERRHCVCGASLEEGTQARVNLEKIKQFIPPQSIGNVVGRFKQSLQDMYASSKCDDAPLEARTYYENARIADKNNADDEERLNDISRSLSTNANFAGQVRQAEMAIKDCEKQKNDLLVRIGSDTKQKEQYSKVLDLCTKHLQAITQDHHASQHIMRCIAYTNALIERFEAELETRLITIREGLDREVKTAFKALGWTDLVPYINEKYEFSCVSSSDQEQYKLSQAQSLVAGLSCIAGIIALGKQIVNKDKTQADTIESVPLVMDAPLSAFDKTRIQSFGINIPDITEQLILFIKDTDGDIVFEAMKDRVGIAKRLVNISPTESECIELEP